MAREEPAILCPPPDHGEQETGVQSRYQRPEGSQHHAEQQGPDLPLSTVPGQAGRRQRNSRDLVGNTQAKRRSEGLHIPSSGARGVWERAGERQEFHSLVSLTPQHVPPDDPLPVHPK